MEWDQDKVFDGSGPPAQGLLQDSRGAIYHLFEIVVHWSGNIEHKGQGWGAVTWSNIILNSGICQNPVHTDTERQG